MSAEPSYRPEAALEALLEAMDEGTVVFDESHRCRAVGRRIGELFGVEPRTLVGLSRHDLVARLAACSDQPEAVIAAVGEEALTVEATVADPIELHRPRERTVVWTSVPVVVAGAPAGRLDVLRDVTRERGAERATEAMAKKLEEVSTVDAVTGLPNRRRFEQESEREHRRAQRAWDSYAIARLDVDGMAAHNARLGREVGDELLRKLGEQVRAARREYDVVARWENDELIVLLPGADGPAARTVVKRAVRAIRDGVLDVAGGLAVTVCAGAAVWIPPSGESADDIIRRAGAALAVARGKGPCSFEIDAGFGEWKEEMSEGASDPPPRG